MSQFETLRAPGAGAATRRNADVARSRAKRGVDIAVAVTALSVLAPALLLIMALIWLEDRSPVIFRQRRTGLDGRTFPILKFRTMRVAECGADVRQATRGDTRVTRVGAILRALSLDELPQLMNVLRGEMSLVGPRPHALAHDEAWAQLAPAYRRRFRTRPGLTGLAAVEGHRGEVTSVEEILRRIEADNVYIDNWSLQLDLKILWRTVPLMFRDPNAY